MGKQQKMAKIVAFIVLIGLASSIIGMSVLYFLEPNSNGSHAQISTQDLLEMYSQSGSGVEIQVSTGTIN